MTHTSTTNVSDASAMGNGNKKPAMNSLSADDLSKHSAKFLSNTDVANWSSDEVQHWVKHQCGKYELKKATVEKFQMNGPAFVLLTKHDFLRRSPDGGEILYYALQRLINPNKFNSSRLDQSSLKNESSNQHPRIVEIKSDDEYDCLTNRSSPKPIIEEPDDPPKIHRSKTQPNQNHFQQSHSRPFFFTQAYAQPAVYTMSAGAAAAYFQQQPQFSFHPHLIHQYHPTMSAQGILIEIMDDFDQNGYIPDGANGAYESLFMVTMNGQRYIMNEDQVRQLVTDAYQREHQQRYLEQQQHLQHQRRQQQYFQQQQRYFEQQQQQRQQQQYFEQQQQQQQQQQPYPDQQRF